MPVDIRVAKLREMFLKLNDFCLRNNIRSFPIFGTLLGIVRDKDIIEHDFDIDMAVLCDDWKKFKSKMYELKPFFKIIKSKFLWFDKIRMEKDEFSIDVLKYNKKSSVPFSVLVPAQSIYRNIPVNYIMPLKKTKVLFNKEYIDIYLPNQEIKLIEKFYGKDWKTPKL